MKYPKYLKPKQVETLRYEVVSDELRAYLTRLLRERVFRSDGESSSDGAVQLINANTLINTANTIMGLPIYRLDPDDWGDYQPMEYGWHQGELDLILRRPDTVQLVEILCELIDRRYFTSKKLSELFMRDGSSIRFSHLDGKTSVTVLKLDELEQLAQETSQDSSLWHSNIRLLVKRLEDALVANDSGLVIATAGSIFETLAKDIIAEPQIQNQSLGGFFGKYRHTSALPSPVVDWVEQIFKDRNTLPLAGHGALTPPPALKDDEATALVEMTKAFISIEYKLRLTKHPPVSSTAAVTKKGKAPPSP